MTFDAFRDVRVPRAIVRHQASERLLTMLGVQIVDDIDDPLEQAARDWLKHAERTDWGGGHERVTTKAVRTALATCDERRRTAA